MLRNPELVRRLLRIGSGSVGATFLDSRVPFALSHLAALATGFNSVASRVQCFSASAGRSPVLPASRPAAVATEAEEEDDTDEDEDDEDEDGEDYSDELAKGDAPVGAKRFGADKGRGGRLLKPGAAGGKSSGGKGSARMIKPPCNWEIRSIAPQVRVVDGETGENLGVMNVAKGIELAQGKGLDLVLIAATASPPVARITALHKVTAALKQAESDKKKAARLSKAKEMRFTARISEHDLDTKASRVISFLREGRQVRVSVSFTLSAWIQEEPSRREVMAKLVRKVAESGSGYCDANSLKGEGPNLNGLFNPCSTPKPAAEVEKALSKLAAPIVPAGQEQSAAAMVSAASMAASEAAGASMSPPPPPPPSPNKAGSNDKRLLAVRATAAAALAGVASKATIEAVLPPPSVLRAFKSKRAGSGLRSAVGTDEDKRDASDSKRIALGVGDDESDNSLLAGDVNLPTGGLMPKGKQRPSGGGRKR